MNEPIEIKSNTLLNISSQHLNVVLGALESMPYKAAAPIIQEIHRQILEQHGPKPDQVSPPAG